MALAIAAYVAWGEWIALERARAWAQVDGLLRATWTSVPAGPAFLVWDDDLIARRRLLQLRDHEHPERVLVQPSHLTHPAPRLRFQGAYDFDPISGLEPLLAAPIAPDDAEATRRVVDAIAENLNRHSEWRVYLFPPQVPSVRLLIKPLVSSRGGPAQDAPLTQGSDSHGSLHAAP